MNRSIATLAAALIACSSNKSTPTPSTEVVIADARAMVAAPDAASAEIRADAERDEANKISDSQPGTPALAMPTGYACAPGTEDRSAGSCTCPTGFLMRRDSKDVATCARVGSDPACEAALVSAAEAKGDEAVSRGQFAAALAAWTPVLSCKPALGVKAYLAACRAKSFPRAKQLFKSLTKNHDEMARRCIEQGFDPRPAQIAESNCRCDNSVGVPLDETHCGYQVCGTDHQVYRCLDTGLWELVEPVRQCPAPGRLARTTQPVAIQLGGDCSKGQACAAAAMCVSYFGIAGARGPTFRSCEIRCTASSGCPSGTTCLVIADGPGKVCR